MALKKGNRQRLNIEIKARVSDHGGLRDWLLSRNAEFRGTDRQVDTYFVVQRGRLKVREGTVEACIVSYDRPDSAKPKACRYHIVTYEPGDTRLVVMKELLAQALDIRCTVVKDREIYYIGNVKFHLDTVEGLGTFFEIEAIWVDGESEADLRRQCGYYMYALGIDEDDLVTMSYADMIGFAGE